MLTEKNIMGLLSEGVILVKKKFHPKLKGEWDVSSLTAYIYLNNIEDDEDRIATITHELIHARNDLYKYKLDENKTEIEALKTVNRFPYISEYFRYFEE